ncbi:hypothetical protein KJ765_00095 [Candidatus Micrarchaeota archaeon]|nr:hypothetical protein [Candidatus Micrarchaeota archaeon]
MVFDELLGKKSKSPESQKTIESSADTSSKEIDSLKLKIRFFRRIIDRYATLVNENEEKTIPELKTLVQPENEAVLELKERILAEVAEDKKKSGTAGESPAYVYEHDFLFAADKAFTNVRNMKNIHSDLAVLFWLTPRESLDLNAGDLFDKAVLLCSVLKALGANPHVRVLELEKNRIHPVVAFAFEDREYILDASQEDATLTKYCGKLEEVLKTFSFDDSRFLKSAYEFNDAEYQNF